MGARGIPELETFLAKYASSLSAPSSASQTRIQDVANDTSISSNVTAETPSEARLLVQARDVNVDGELRVLDKTSLPRVVAGDEGPTFVKLCVLLFGAQRTGLSQCLAMHLG